MSRVAPCLLVVAAASSKPAYIRGPEGIIVGLAQERR